jgi:transcriptional regulator with XRE-family HTH domain
MASPNAWPELGRRIRRLRLMAEIKQADLAKAADISAETMNRIEKGSANCRVDTLARIARRLGVSVDELVPEIGTESDPSAAA